MIIGFENVGETEKANDCRNDTSGFRLIAKLPNRNRLIPGVPPLVTAAPSHTYTQNRFFSDSVSLKALDSQASQEASSRVSAKPNGLGHRAHRSRPRSKLPQDSSAAAPQLSSSPANMPSEPATLSGFPANLTVTVTLLDAKHPPAARHRQHSRRLLRPRSGHEPAETTVVNRSSPVSLPFHLGSFY
ncbi:uncharacterized protein N7525_006705 [Penicillium rubens]|nr:uncharacterized protein N7525_006705 [Penicillium rubens]KAJ5828452.1 hypothetical protein N7525_006705 [Penicillium rubens]KAJ5841818.1 hypothetical protein N7534_011648 [Penicillium rubens]